jgi:hypothetical protein
LLAEVNVMTAVALWEGLDVLVAVTVTVCPLSTQLGAVYSPLPSMLPTLDGEIDQVTPTLAVNCCVWLAESVTVLGVMVTPPDGVKVIEAMADFVVSAWLVAVIVTVCCVETVAGAVYRPALLIVPAPVAGEMLQVTAVLLE